MTIKNCLELSNVETKIAVRLTEKTNQNEFEGIKKARKVKTKETLLDKLRNPETKEFYYLSCITKPVSFFCKTNLCASSILLATTLLSAITVELETGYKPDIQYTEAIKLLLKYIAISTSATVPFLITDALQQDASERHNWTKEKEKITLTKKELERKTLSEALKIIKSVKKDDKQFKYNFARSLLENTDISKNSTEYNEKLLLLLAKIVEEENEENLEALAEHLDKNNTATADNAAKVFLNNEVVKQLVKSYSPKRS